VEIDSKFDNPVQVKVVAFGRNFAYTQLRFLIMAMK
jgi:hypothetical protein